jgi:TRAP-type mannitol/chloroaromatic compound transport system permease small subunit
VQEFAQAFRSPVCFAADRNILNDGTLHFARGGPLQALLAISRLIDALNERIGRSVLWLVLVAALISAFNAIYRKIFNDSSNALLEIQWYLFGAIFLLCAGYTLKHEGHVRIDVLYGKLSRRTQTWIDIFGTIFFLLPICVVLAWLSWPVFIEAFVSKEISSDAGGLIRWPIRLMIPIGFVLLVLQGISELIKRIERLRTGDYGAAPRGIH